MHPLPLHFNTLHVQVKLCPSFPLDHQTVFRYSISCWEGWFFFRVPEWWQEPRNIAMLLVPIRFVSYIYFVWSHLHYVTCSIVLYAHASYMLPRVICVWESQMQYMHLQTNIRNHSVRSSDIVNCYSDYAGTAYSCARTLYMLDTAWYFSPLAR